MILGVKGHFNILAGLKKLEALNINCLIHPSLSLRLTNLKELQIFCSKVTDHGVTFLKGLHKHALLNMERCPITSACLDSLSDLVGLHYLKDGFRSCLEESFKMFEGWPCQEHSWAETWALDSITTSARSEHSVHGEWWKLPSKFYGNGMHFALGEETLIGSSYLHYIVHMESLLEEAYSPTLRCLYGILLEEAYSPTVPPPPVMTHKRTFPFSQLNMSGSMNSPLSARKSRSIFLGKLMKEVIEKQEELQMRFLDTLERREKDQVATEEA
ncbi:F-box/LRR-repeat protein 14-like protein isoform X1 [Tanacetum coccineum]|uniref:F-box/LRR-repeat protein 14-like protein isoform X1 n=1 Tax=Tanacetum coccineum TaxID=301880 RepID=A0ABQ4XGB2_9ASTR